MGPLKGWEVGFGQWYLVAKRVEFGQYYGFIFSQSMGQLKGVQVGIYEFAWDLRQHASLWVRVQDTCSP